MEHGPTAVDGDYFQERASVTLELVDAYATPIVTAKKMVSFRQPTKALTVSSGCHERMAAIVWPQ